MEKTDAAARLCFIRNGMLEPCDSVVCWVGLAGCLAPWSPLQLIGPLAERLPMVIWYDVFGVVFVLAQVGNDAAIHSGVVFKRWLYGRVGTLGYGRGLGGPCVSLGLTLDVVESRGRAVRVLLS